MRALLRSFILPFSAALLLGAAAACGGGGGSSPTPATVQSGGGSGSGSNVTTTGTAAATFAVALQQYAPVQTSALKRRTAFLSPATAQISLTIVSVNGVAATGTPQTFAVGPTAPNCASVGGVVTCTLSAVLPLGTDVVSASTLDAGGRPLGTSQIAATVVQNSSNRISLAIGGTIASLEIFLSKQTFTPGVPATANVIVVPLDSSGAAIVNPGNYNPSIALALSGSSHFDLITDGGTPAVTSTINSPNDQVVLSYDGATGSGSATVTSTAVGITPPVFAITTANFTTAGPPSLNVSPSGQQYQSTSSYIFSSPGQTGTVVSSGGTGPYTITSSAPSVASVSGTSPNFTVTAVGYGTSGTATLTISDNASPTHASTTIPVTFQAPPIALAVTSCGTNATCSPYSVTGPQVTTTITATGGTGTYSYVFVTTQATTSPYASVSQAGNQFSITPNASGNDALIIVSGNATNYYGIVSNRNALAQSLPKAFGFRLNTPTAFSVGSASETISSCLVTTGTLAGLNLAGGAPGTLSATNTSLTSGVITCADSLGYTAATPFNTIGLTFGTYQGAGNLSNPLAVATEAFTGISESDLVTVSLNTGSVATVTSGNTGIVTITGVGAGLFTVNAVGAGTTTVTVTDTIGASYSYNVSVTTTTIPIAGLHRRN